MSWALPVMRDENELTMQTCYLNQVANLLMWMIWMTRWKLKMAQLFRYLTPLQLLHSPPRRRWLAITSRMSIIGAGALIVSLADAITPLTVPSLAEPGEFLFSLPTTVSYEMFKMRTISPVW